MKTIKLTAAAMLAAFTASCAATAPAFAQTASNEQQVPLCYSAPLMGPGHTINPHAPKDKRVQEKATICDFALVGSGKDRHVEPLQQPLIIPPAPGHIA